MKIFLTFVIFQRLAPNCLNNNKMRSVYTRLGIIVNCNSTIINSNSTIVYFNDIIIKTNDVTMNSNSTVMV